MAGGVYQTAVQLAAALMTVLCAALYPAGRGPVLGLITAVGIAGLAVALRGLLPRRAADPADRSGPSAGHPQDPRHQPQDRT
jgi:hypothetical protein